MALMLPTGLKNSFNADVCCGYAMMENVDDVGFVIAAVDDLEKEVVKGSRASATPEEPVDHLIKRDAILGIGWSDGAFLTSKIALERNFFAAIALISGGVYEGFENAVGSVPIMIHHSLDDTLVRFSGCCRDARKPKCCCFISDRSPETCSSTHALYQKWGSVNQCQFESGGKMRSTSTFVSDPNSVSCQSGVACVRRTREPCRVCT